MNELRTLLAAAGIALCVCLAGRATAADAVGAGATPVAAAAPTVAAPGSQLPVADAPWNLHGQFTNVFQWHPAFTSPYQGDNSLNPGNDGKETTDVTLFAGVRLWNGAAAYVNPEIDQGFGLDGTLGAGGFPSGEAYKVGAQNPYFRLPRAFVRQIIDLHGNQQPAALDDGANQLAEPLPADNVTITIGKFAAVDVFDSNRYAHDPRSDFLNWALVESGAFDYAADAWGYTYGAAVEWTESRWSVRGGVFALSKMPNSKDIDGAFRQFELVAEFEERHQAFGQPGKFKTLVFLNRGLMGNYEQAVALARRTSAPADTGLVRRYASRPGVALNLEQELGGDLGVFARASFNDGAQEAFDFTEINKSVAAGASMRGSRWNRPDDTVGVGVAVDGLSAAARDYFAVGGLGILIGDGRLPNYGPEKIVETYYSAKVAQHLTVAADYQSIAHPAYNRDRGPVSILGLRVHVEF